MEKDSSQRIVIIAMNAFRPGGSQTYAFTLARMLRDQGMRPVLVAKPGLWYKSARESSEAIRVMWSEETSDDSAGPLKRLALRSLEKMSAIRLSGLVRSASLIISSQPGPTAFFAKMSHQYWPQTPRVALVHGTSSVEWPFRSHEATLTGLKGLLAATQETTAFLRGEVSPNLAVREIGNLFSAPLFWGDDLDDVIQNYDPSGPVIFLGTLTPNKTAPMSALFSAIAALGLNLIIVGGGPNEPTLKAMVMEKGLQEAVLFTGAVGDPRPWISKASIVVTAGRGAIESMAAGRPTLVATSDGVHGIARLHELPELERFNFTGRTPSSQHPLSDRMNSHLLDGLAMPHTERLEIADQMENIGSLLPILNAIHEP